MNDILSLFTIISQTAISIADWYLWNENVKKKDEIQALEKEYSVNFNLQEGGQENFWFFRNWISKEYLRDEIEREELIANLRTMFDPFLLVEATIQGIASPIHYLFADVLLPMVGIKGSNVDDWDHRPNKEAQISKFSTYINAWKNTYETIVGENSSSSLYATIIDENGDVSFVPYVLFTDKGPEELSGFLPISEEE